MNKINVSASLLVFLFLFLGIAQAAPFTIVSSKYSISGTMSISDVDNNNLYTGSYGVVNSASPVFDELNYESFSVSGGASYNEVYALPIGDFGANPNITKRIASAYAEASTDIIFSPNFGGLGPSIYVYPTGNNVLLTRNTFVLSDITSGTLIAALYSNGSAVYDRFGASWYVPGILINSFLYDNWDPSHLYELSMTVAANDPFPAPEGERGWGGFETNLTFNNVPEPTTMLLLSLGLIGVSRIRRKIEK